MRHALSIVGVVVLLCGCSNSPDPILGRQSDDDKTLADLKEIGSLTLESDANQLTYHRGSVLIAGGIHGLGSV